MLPEHGFRPRPNGSAIGVGEAVEIDVEQNWALALEQAPGVDADFSQVPRHLPAAEDTVGTDGTGQIAHAVIDAKQEDIGE